MSAAATDDSAALRRARARRLAGLYAVTPDLADTADLVARVEAALAGGAARSSTATRPPIAALARAQAAALARVHAARGALYFVNDDPVLAAAVGADGVHLGEDDGAIAAARAIVGPDRLVGVSCYNDLALARSRRRRRRRLRRVRQLLPLEREAGRACAPTVAAARRACARRAGGRDRRHHAGNAGDLFAAGADAVAVISAVFAAGDVADAPSADEGRAPARPRLSRARRCPSRAEVARPRSARFHRPGQTHLRTRVH